MAKKGRQGDGGGRPEYQIDYETLDGLCEIMCTKNEIVHLLKVDEKTLSTALVRDGNGGFSDYYKKVSAKGKKSLRRKQYQKAIDDGNTTMLIWLGKQLLGQTDKSEVTTKTDRQKMSEDELRIELDRVRKTNEEAREIIH